MKPWSGSSTFGVPIYPWTPLGGYIYQKDSKDPSVVSPFGK